MNEELKMACHPELVSGSNSQSIQMLKRVQHDVICRLSAPIHNC